MADRKMRRLLDDKHAELMRFITRYDDDCYEGRKRAQRDRDYYDGDQWTDEERRVLEKRGQPIITVNKIAPKLNYLLGYEIRTRIDPKAFPRTPVHEDEANAITDALRFVCDKEGFDYIRSDATEDLLIEGVGGIHLEPEIDGDEVDIRMSYVPWERIFYDPRSARADFADAKYVGIFTLWDFDDACADATYGQHKALLEESLAGADEDESFGSRPNSKQWADATNKRIRIVEVYWREGGKWMVAHFTRAGFLVTPREVPLRDEKGRSWCPLILTSAFVARAHNRINERYGVARNMISLQDEVNKRRSKSLHLLNMRQVIAEQGVTQDPMTLQAELAKPDGIAMVAADALKSGRIQINNTTDLAQGQLQMLQEAKVELDAVGPEAPVIGGDRRTMSGRAIIARQQMGAMELEPVFDNLRAWQKRVFRGIWRMIRQFWPEERWVRVRDDNERTGWRFVALNQRMTRAQRMQDLMGKGMQFAAAVNSIGLQPVDVQRLMQMATQAAQQQAQQFAPMLQAQGQQMPPQMVEQLTMQALMQAPEMSQEVLLNDVGCLDVDIILDAVPDTTIIQQEEFAELADFAQSQPGVIPPQVLIQASGLRNKRELLAMLEKKPDPIQQQMVQLQLQQLAATIERTKAQAADEQASAQERLASIGKVQAEAENQQAQAMEHAANAGEKSGPTPTGPVGPMGVM